MNTEVLALVVSGVAILFSARAVFYAKVAWLQALRTEVRRDLDHTLAEASKLLDKAVTLTEATMLAANEINDDGGSFRPDEREAFALRDDARQPLAELKHINTDLRAKSRKELEAILHDVTRIRRSIDGISMKLDIKNTALDQLLDKSQATGNPSDRKVEFRSFSQEPKPGKEDA